MPSYTLEQLTALQEAISQGARRVKYADKEVEYRSLDEMLSLEDKMKKDLGIVPAGGRRKYGEFNKGLL